MTYRYYSNNTLEDGAGRKIEILGRVGINYTFGERKIWVDSEMLGSSYGFALYASNQRLEQQGNGAPQLLDSDKVETIFEILRAFNGLNIKLEIV
jgi:hypothetical protein